MIPVRRTIIITTEVRRKARHSGRPVSRKRVSPIPPASLPLPPVFGLGSPTSRERFLTDVMDLWPCRPKPSLDLQKRNKIFVVLEKNYAVKTF